MLKKIVATFRERLTPAASSFDREVIAQLQNTIDRLHSDNIRLTAEHAAALYRVRILQNKIEDIATAIRDETAAQAVFNSTQNNESK